MTFVTGLSDTVWRFPSPLRSFARNSAGLASAWIGRHKAQVPDVDPKAGERAYYARLGDEGRRHARAKPFSDAECGRHLSNLGAILQMLPLPPGRVLDCGCGTGWTSLFLARAGYDVTGIDLSPDAIAIARELAAEEAYSRAQFLTADYESFAEKSSFDAVLFYDALHHAEDERAVLRVAFEALKTGGVVVVVEPGLGHSRSEGARHAVAEFGVHEKDMPPRYVWRLAKQIGFSQKLWLPYPHEWARAAFRRDFQRVPRTQARLRAEQLWGLLRGASLFWRARRAGMLLLWK